MRFGSLVSASALAAALLWSGLARADERGAGAERRWSAPPIQLAQAEPGRVRASRIGRLGFVVPPERAEDQDLATVVQYVADTIGKECVATEVFKWAGVDDPSGRTDKIFLAFDQALENKGYDAILEEIKPPPDPEAAAGLAGFMAYVAQTRNVHADHPLIVFVWHFEGNDVYLALCQAQSQKEESNEE